MKTNVLQTARIWLLRYNWLDNSIHNCVIGWDDLLNYNSMNCQSINEAQLTKRNYSLLENETDIPNGEKTGSKNYRNIITRIENHFNLLRFNRLYAMAHKEEQLRNENWHCRRQLNVKPELQLTIPRTVERNLIHSIWQIDATESHRSERCDETYLINLTFHPRVTPPGKRTSERFSLSLFSFFSFFNYVVTRVVDETIPWVYMEPRSRSLDQDDHQWRQLLYRAIVRRIDKSAHGSSRNSAGSNK